MKSLLACLVGLLLAVQATPVSPPVVSGQVRLSDGSPVVGTQVVLFDVADLRRGPVGQATTDAAGRFALPLSAGGALAQPQEVGLGPNYPNPFNPSTIIPYQLAATSPVRLEVFNVLGQPVATLVDEEQGAGSYRAWWDGTDASGDAAASGVYIYRLTVAGAYWTGKMVLLDGQAGVPLGGARVEVVSQAAGSGSSAAYGLVVSGPLVTYVDAAFGVEGGMGSVDIEVAAAPLGRMKAVPAAAMPSPANRAAGPGLAPQTLAGVLGDVNNDGRVEIDDGLLVAMQRVDPAGWLPNEGQLILGDVNSNGQIELADAALIATYVTHPSLVASLSIGQRGGYSLNPVTEMVWDAILDKENKDATVARILDGVPVVMSGVRQIKGELYLYLGIGSAYWSDHGGQHIYQALQERFPLTPLWVEPSRGIQRPRVGDYERGDAGTLTIPPAGKAADDDCAFCDLFDTFNDQQDEEAETEEEAAGTDSTSSDEGPGPDLIVQSPSVSRTTLTAGQAFTLQVTVHNQGDQQAAATTLRYYRSNNATITARDTEVGTDAVEALDASASRAHSIELTAPNVSSPRVGIYYGACVESVSGESKTDNNCSPAVKTVVYEQETEDDAVDTPVDVDRLEVMGGEPIGGHFRASERNYRTDSTPGAGSAGTLTLGGLTTTNGTKGFVLSGHAAIDFGVSIIEEFKAARTDALIFGGYNIKRFLFLGKVMQLPHPHETGVSFEFLYADAAFVAYPSIATSDCSLTWTGDDTNRMFCLDLGKGEQIETVTPLAIRGKHNAVYNVVGSQSPTMGLEVMFTGSRSGVVEGNQVTSSAMLTMFSYEGGTFSTYDLDGGGESAGGDSGSPIYTVPDRNGNVRIIGIIHGSAVVAGEEITAFCSWDDVMKELDLQPIP